VTFFCLPVWLYFLRRQQALTYQVFNKQGDNKMSASFETLNQSGAIPDKDKEEVFYRLKEWLDR